jgi:hypothetical protein
MNISRALRAEAAAGSGEPLIRRPRFNINPAVTAKEAALSRARPVTNSNHVRRAEGTESLKHPEYRAIIAKGPGFSPARPVMNINPVNVVLAAAGSRRPFILRRRRNISPAIIVKDPGHSLARPVMNINPAYHAAVLELSKRPECPAIFAAERVISPTRLVMNISRARYARERDGCATTNNLIG